MFCYQCEQTAKGSGCTIAGVCGKDATTATLQDLLLFATKGISMYAHRARRFGAKDHEIDTFVPQALFSTITNVNFDPERIEVLLRKAAQLLDKARAMYEVAYKKAGETPEKLRGPAAWVPADDIAGLVRQGQDVSIAKKKERFGDEITGLMELYLYGLKGTGAYADHAEILGVESDEVYAAFHEALDFLTRDSFTVEELFDRCLAEGKLNLKVMELLDRANTGTYGHPEPTSVRVTPVKGKAILVSGHDLRDLEELLKQTEGKGINVYTHGEMLPTLAYPGLKKYKHLVGNYGGAWYLQTKEFDAFPGAMLMTTNCIQKPRESYKDRIFTA